MTTAEELRTALVGPTPPPFVEFPKVPRLFRSVVITEKIDGTNGCVYVPESESEPLVAGSRSRWISPEVDNFGFARWVRDNEAELRKLGPGVHYGEWWGSGIQRRYGLDHKRFSLFNVGRWSAENVPPCVHVVPTLAVLDKFSTAAVAEAIEWLRANGSRAAPGFMRPEGVVVFHAAAGALFKATLENDERPKGSTEVP
jgi:hypothetical protein